MTSRPWWQNAEHLSASVVRHLLKLPRYRMDQLLAAQGVPTQPGVYAVFFAGAPLVELFGPLLGSGRYVAYVGVGERNLRHRLRRYVQTLGGTVVDPAQLFLALLPCSSSAAALFVESALIAAYRPVCNGIGWGSVKPGSRRTKQRCSLASALLGRNWTTPATPTDLALARMHILAYLMTLDPHGPRWDPLFGPSASPPSMTPFGALLTDPWASNGP